MEQPELLLISEHSNQTDKLQELFNSDSSADTVKLDQLLQGSTHQIRTLYLTAIHKYHNKHRLYTELCARFKSLQDDFVYNIKLIKDRDAELESLEMVIADLKAISHDSDARIGELKMALSERMSESSALKSALQTSELEHQEILRKTHRIYNDDIEKLADKMKAKADELELEKSKYLVQIKTAIQDSDLQKSTFDSQIASLKRDHDAEIRSQKQAFEAGLTDAEHRVAKRDSEIAALKAMHHAHQISLNEQIAINQDLDKRLRQKQWDMTDCNKMTAERISELELIIQRGNEESDIDRQEYNTKLSEIQLKAEQQTKILNAEIERLESQVSNLNLKLQESHSIINSNQNQHHDTVVALKNEVQVLKHSCFDLEEHVESLKSTMSEMERNHSQELFASHKDITHLHAKITRLETDVDNRRNDVKLLKTEISERIAKERELEKQLLQETQTREKSLVEQERQHELNMDIVTKQFQEEIQMAHAEARALESSMQRQSNYTEQSIDPQMENLINENLKLRGIVREMRQEMESLQTQLLQPQMNDDYPPSPPARPPKQYALDSHFQQNHLRPKDVLNDNYNLEVAGSLETHRQVHSTRQLNSESSQKHDFRPVFSQKQDLSNFSDTNAEMDDLKRRLDACLNDFQIVCNERDQFMDMSNTLRAERRLAETQSKKYLDSSTQTTTKQHKPVSPIVVTDILKVQAAPMNPSKEPLIRTLPVSTRIRQKPRRRLIVTASTNQSASIPTHTTPLESLTNSEKKALVAMALRSRGVRNWNDQHDALS
ncbi:Coiled-coil domain-containing protein 57 [Batrachochytrium dendrobatidis]|nr:Coiled-coil domain-containing protein 57 [Batrachochytrium dendrobatidis]